MMNNNMNVNLSVGDKIKLVKPIGPLGKDFVGDVYEITKYENGLYYFECPYGMGCFTPNEFDNHFEIANENDGKKYDEHVSMWNDMVNAYREMIGDNYDCYDDDDDCSDSDYGCNGRCCGCDCHDDDCDSIYMNEDGDFEFELDDDIPEYIENILDNSEILCRSEFDCCAVVSCKLPNNHIIVEYSVAPNPDYYDYEEHVKICMEKIVCELMRLEEYRVKWNRYTDKNEHKPKTNINVDIDVDKVNKRIKQALEEEEVANKLKSYADKFDMSKYDVLCNKNNHKLEFRIDPWYN